MRDLIKAMKYRYCNKPSTNMSFASSNLSTTPKNSGNLQNFLKRDNSTFAYIGNNVSVKTNDEETHAARLLKNDSNSPVDCQAIIRLKRLLAILGISRSLVYLKLKPNSKYYDPMFPKSIRLGKEAVGWYLSDVYDYIENLRSRENIS